MHKPTSCVYNCRQASIFPRSSAASPSLHIINLFLSSAPLCWYYDTRRQLFIHAGFRWILLGLTISMTRNAAIKKDLIASRSFYFYYSISRPQHSHALQRISSSCCAFSATAAPANIRLYWSLCEPCHRIKDTQLRVKIHASNADTSRPM